MSDNIFITATRTKLRFDHPKGQLSVEQLWDLKLSGEGSLDQLAIETRRKLREEEDGSLVSPKRVNNTTALKFEILSFIINTKLAEIAEREKAAEQAQLRNRAREILAERKDEGLRALSTEELAKLAQ